jgi:hypothetical protein
VLSASGNAEEDPIEIEGVPTKECWLLLNERLLEIARAPLSSVIDDRARVSIGSGVEGWDLPESDREALRDFGLPDGPYFVPSYQAGIEPDLVPNVASAVEARLIRPEDRLYMLGRYGPEKLNRDGRDFTNRVGAVAGSGRVLGIRRLAMTTADIAPHLREMYPNVYNPPVSYFSASVATFVEVAWRWYAAVGVLRAHMGPHYLAPTEEQDRHYEEIEQSCAGFLGELALRDPTLADEDLGSLWAEAITEDF